MTRHLSLVLATLTLSACSHGYWPDAYTWPSGYTNHDITPISSPHGYDKTIADETAMKGAMQENAGAWRNGLAQILVPIHSALDMNIPIAVVMDPGMTPLNASATNYLRDLLVDMSYLSALPSETTQALVVRAVGTDRAGEVYVTLTIKRGETKVISHDGVIMVDQASEVMGRMPGFTSHPSQGPVPDTRPYHNLNQN